MEPTSAADRGGDLPSISQRLNAERVVLLGWGRAILLQLAHPLIAAGVHDHSSFRATPWAAATRLYHTVRAMLALTFGTPAERERALDGIRTIHRRVNGSLSTGVGQFPAGTCYSAEDPDLVLWVHATLLDSVPLAYEQFVGPLTTAERDAYCAEAAWVAVALNARDADVPRTWADARALLERTYASGVLGVSEQTRELARDVVSPSAARLLPGAGWANRTVTLGLLPAQVRDQYGWSWTEGDERAYNAVVRIVRATRRTMPDAVALWPEARNQS